MYRVSVQVLRVEEGLESYPLNTSTRTSFVHRTKGLQNVGPLLLDQALHDKLRHHCRGYLRMTCRDRELYRLIQVQGSKGPGLVGGLKGTDSTLGRVVDRPPSPLLGAGNRILIHLQGDP